MTSSSAIDEPAGSGRIGGAIALLGAVAVVSVTFSVAASSIAMGASFALLGFVAARRGIRALRATGLEAAFALYAAAEVVSTAFSVDRADSLYNMKRVLLTGLAYVAAFAFRERGRTVALLAALALTGALTASVELLGLQDAGTGLVRPTMFQMPMTEGGVRMLILLVLLPLAVSGALRPALRALVAVSLVPILAGLILSLTRGAWLAFGAGALVLGIAWDRRILAGLAAMALLFFLLAPVGLRYRALSVFEFNRAPAAAHDSVTTAAESNSSRVQMLSTGWRMFLDRPLLGWGDIGLRPYYVRYITPYTEGEGGHLHNNLMQALVTLGLPGFCIVVWLYWRMFVVIRRSGRGAPRDSFRGALGAGVLAAYAGFHVMGLVEYNFGDHEVMVLVWFLAGLASALPSWADGGGGA